MISPRTRQYVFDRAGGMCEYHKPDGSRCCAPAQEIQHVIPKGRGGTDDVDNLAASCVNCHHSVIVDGRAYMGHRIWEA